MNKFESINDSLFQKLETNEMSNVKGGERLWHTWITGRTKTTTATGCVYTDRMEYDEDCDCKVEVIDFGSSTNC